MTERPNESQAIDLQKVLTRARVKVDQHWCQRSLSGDEASEEELTITYLMASSPEVRYAQFNRRQEGTTGADWLWWFVDKSGECFGMLVQAKKLHHVRDNWNINFGYQSGDEPQMNKFLALSNHLEVPAVYVLYCGDATYRGGMPCGRLHLERDCDRCDRASVSALPAICARSLSVLNSDAKTAFAMAEPVEDLVVPGMLDVVAIDPNFQNMSAELKEFLMTPQVGSREVAKKVFKIASVIRKGQFSAVSSTLSPSLGDTVFSAFPLDTGHFGVPYVEHILRGLKPSLPIEIELAMSGGYADGLPSFEKLSGIALFSF